MMLEFWKNATGKNKAFGAFAAKSSIKSIRLSLS